MQETISHASPLMLLAGLLMSTLSMHMPDASSMYWQGGSQITGMLTDEALDEVSGLAASKDSDFLWAHNDSGDRARLFVLAADGGLHHTVRIEGIDLFDAEDLTRGPCVPGSPKTCLFLGDMGDNRHIRDAIVIYRIEEPSLEQHMPDSVSIDHAIWLTHPDGKPMDAEALMSDPNTGELYIFEKSRTGESRLLKVPARALTQKSSGRKPFELEVVATTSITHTNRSGRLVTSGTFSPEGRCLVLRTYLEVLTYCKPDPESTWQEALSRQPDRFVPPGMIQSEAIAFDSTGERLWVTSERRFSPLVQCLRKAKQGDLSSGKK